MKQNTSETDLSRSIRSAIEALGGWVVRVPAGQHRVKGGYLHIAEPGCPDLWTPYGWMEVKLPGGRTSGEQLAWHEKAERFGVRVAVVRSVAEAVDVYRGWRKVAA